jgi:hypothetical protein
MDGFWAEALVTVVYIINMSLSRPLGLKIPQELWTGRKPDYDKLWIFGCKAYALVPKDEHRKLKSRSRKRIFLGYGNAFSLVTDLTEVSAIVYGTRKLTSSSEVRT